MLYQIKIHNQKIKFFKKNLELFYKKKFIPDKENFFLELIENLPSFSKKLQLINSAKLTKFSNELPSYLINYYQAEKQIVQTARKIQENFQKSEEMFKELLLRVDDLGIMESLGNYFGLPCTSKISSSNKNLKMYFEILKNEVSKMTKFFSSDMFQYFQFHRQETQGFLKLQKNQQAIKKKMDKMKSDMKKKNLFTENVKNDMLTFDSYLNYLNYQNFKIIYRAKNEKINFNLLENYKKDMNFYSQQFSELEKLKEVELQEQNKKLASSILVSHDAMPRSNTEQILWQSVIPRKEMQKIEIDQNMSISERDESEDL